MNTVPITDLNKAIGELLEEHALIMRNGRWACSCGEFPLATLDERPLGQVERVSKIFLAHALRKFATKHVPMAAQKKTAFEMFEMRVPADEVYKHIAGVSRPTVYRWHKHFKTHLPLAKENG